METRANHLWVGAVTLVLLAALAAFIVWLTRAGEGSQSEYDIFYGQTVSGLARGSQVSFAGVPVGQVSDIALSEDDPEFVRVRIRVQEDVPILVGTTATIQSSFTGVSTILLDGARKNAPAITCETTACPEGRPVIPPKDGGINALLNSAPVLLERLATLTENLNLLLGPENQKEITNILYNTDRLTAGLADATPELKANLEEFRVSMQEFNETMEAIQDLTRSTDELVQGEGSSLAEELRSTLQSASKAADALAVTLEDVRPATRQLREGTLPAAEATLQDLRATSRSLRSITEKLESEGVGALVEGRTLPDYED
ncbi:phospholipid/cholesterol/gamma-HCH transport system substrate-binding protein [Erythrobacter litoralis]|jgi:phospholipid/cholesterol/gamma-HCH transport system substrate-binding protein|uniref:Mammalian cell entry protein n=1 Tax=Erythrobacter litoralis TaxID=39960 RepID=A0A074MKK4_9SPHN|nr:MlaD family protein [Erythrobacter litoralis]AOL24430.1 phospholipid/cholesterol/gamma-HCH transport system substrate-binding protein [Erythrobacter litoralis]KEO93330.1 mammalian cell entry protein [Erythrobacter litoralis]MEE4338466.1 MlaD family protein [Erythrobacter sp.]